MVECEVCCDCTAGCWRIERILLFNDVHGDLLELDRIVRQVSLMLARNCNFPALVLKELLVLFMAKMSFIVESLSAVSEWLRRLTIINSFS